MMWRLAARNLQTGPRFRKSFSQDNFARRALILPALEYGTFVAITLRVMKPVHRLIRLDLLGDYKVTRATSRGA